MAEADERTHASDSIPLNLPAFIPKLFPFLKPKPPNAVNDANGPNSTHKAVSFPYNPPKNTEPLNFEAEASFGRTSNSLVLWQVYALGGFLVLKWAWGRWNERNDIKEDDDDHHPHHHHHQPSAFPSGW